MILSPSEWRQAWEALGLPTEAVPAHPDFGRLYPWQELLQHSLSPLHRRRVAVAKDRIREALRLHPDLHLGWSAGKDSTAMAALCAEMGIRIPCFGEKDDLDYPGEVAYLSALGARFGLEVEILTPEVSLLQFLKDSRASLVADLHGRTAALSKEHFYGLLRRHRQTKGYAAVMLGLRAAESKGREASRSSHGPLYPRRSDDLIISAPLADWKDEDVHAYLLSRDVPVMPLYLCVDPGMNPLKLRKSWFVAGGGAARYGHYVWLRRWWPDLWEKIADIDPEMRRLS